jgi:ribonuclease P protein subunit POP4
MVTQIRPQDILRHELIGLEVRIAQAKNPTLRGLKGKIVDETRNMLTLTNGGRTLQIPKDVAKFRFRLKEGTLVDVDGVRLIGRPENRLKTKVKHW